MKKRILVGVMAMMMLASSVVPTAAAASQGAMATSVTAHANESMRLQMMIGILIHRQILLSNIEGGLCSQRLFPC